MAGATPGANKCTRCHGSRCCTYATEALGAAPRSKSDFEHLLWQVSHQGVEIYKDADGWYLMFQGACEHLLPPDGACAIYDTRPQICRDYSNDWCEFDEPAEKGFELYFRNHAELLAYCKKRFKSWGKR
ncbi:MAG: zinc/iron-chelating domain-containing protein [Candidatus Sedimenticola endophacoides]|uniref:Zinc/iron-chelating domain-containing protein n=1 Tax=Candidatus Sedimenticola endophacoides TaxID=2548426 RepID=A0A657PXM0_9GAMM|nr:MAG: zinc/iron-chelating domain-containing protein [Candidatus Sedimenticola endophacoides]OQX35347.1 MAG: zinc/iron-chelating domain-containing protein [Candidatus Sedimenticola endophacoides]OQX40567.1 MAG: zinc/iron-chelating domain-containing protein [Candidatus Sedimenticola endophacoides]OQX45062.1 MAG: zinc/iron-chelating domain-containing protein [Candidatus Sedimenticola endophacoides]OQX45862.1 MAG: zinc/iron-chelating domain-containing protein [Candidatus Sedimenticola endophacoid